MFSSYCNYKHEHPGRNTLPLNEVSTIIEKVTKLEEIVANLEMENDELKIKLEELETNKKDQIETESRTIREVLGPGFRSNPSWSFKTLPRNPGKAPNLFI